MSDASEWLDGVRAWEERNGEAPAGPLPLPLDEPAVRWADGDLTLPPALWVPVLRAPKSGTPLRGVAVNDHFTAVWMHYLDGRDVPCRGLDHQCGGCIEGGPAKLSGFLLASRQDLLPAIYHIPAGVLLARPGLARPGAGLRGKAITLTRRPRGRNGYVELAVSDKPARLALGAVLPADEDLKPLLMHLWGLG